MTHEPDAFTRAYIECALWSSFHSVAPLDCNYCVEDIADDTLQQIISDCANFQGEHEALLRRAGSDEQNGHDFWLTRNYHGAGFWDRGYPDAIGQALTDAAQADGSRDLYVGDDGRIYQC